MIVSVVTPTFNSEAWMDTCIASVKMQAVPGLEVEHVVVDGGSTDRTVEIATAAGCTMVGSGHDDGLFDATNIGYRASTGVLVGFLGSDDVLLPGALDALARRYVESGRRWVTGSYVWTDEHFRHQGTISAPPERLSSELHAMLGWSWPCNMATYVERTLYDEIGGYDLSFPVAADYKFLTDAMARAPFARVAQRVAVYRRHGGNMSMSGEPTEELARIADEYGPSEHWKRSYYRFKVKCWVNGRNPAWAHRKFRPLPPAVELSSADPRSSGPDGRKTE